MGKTGYFTHPQCRKHNMGAGHPECPERIDVIEDRLLMTGVIDALERMEPKRANMGELLLAHGRRHVAALRGLHDILEEEVKAGGPDHYSLDTDTVMCTQTYPAALYSAGAGIDAVDAVLSGELENAFCCTRPPGHHATRNQAMGFCFFSNAAIAAKYACERHGLQRVAIIDFDVHHGNGTEDIVAGDARILMCSFFQHPFYPEGGSLKSDSNLLNCPVAAYSKGELVKEIITSQWIPKLLEHNPQLIIISAGFDAHRDDDMGQMGLTEADFAWITNQIKNIANKCCAGKIVSLLEGGYNLDALAKSVEAHIRVLADV